MRWTQVVFSGVGTGICLYAVTAGFNFWFGPWAKRRRTQREEGRRIRDAILGTPAVTDRAGAIEQPAQPGLVAMVKDLQEEWPKNGTRAHLKLERVVKQQEKHEDLLRNHLSDSATAQAALWSAILNIGPGND